MKSLIYLLLCMLPLTSLQSQAQSEKTPRVAIIAQNEGTEITDLLVPFAVLSDAGIDVDIIATAEGPVTLWPAFELINSTTIEEINPDDYDLVIVPAVLNADDPTLQHFVSAFADNGGLTASICDGVNVLATAGLLEGRSATGHFYSHKKRARDFPGVDWIRDRRYVEDDHIISTAGVSASAPASVFLVKKLLGDEAAETAANKFNINPDQEHSVEQFKFRLSDGLTMIGNGAKGLGKKNYAIASSTGVDEYSLAFLADILSRTSQVELGISGATTIQTRHGLTLRGKPLSQVDTEVVLPSTEMRELLTHASGLQIESSAAAVNQLLVHVKEKFGERTARFVSKQLEMPWQLDN